MIFEGTGKYFLILTMVFLIVFLTVKICLSKIFKNMGIPGYKAYIPFYNRLLLIENLDFSKKLFYKTLIPVANLYFYGIIIEKLLEAHNLNPKEAPLYVAFPMYKFPEFVFRKPKFTLHMYDATTEFLTNQQMLYQKVEEEEPAPDIKSIDEYAYNEVLNPGSSNRPNLYVADNVFTNNSLAPDTRKEQFVEAVKQEEKKEETPIIKTVSGTNKICPNCGAKLAPDATGCFFCGTKLS